MPVTRRSLINAMAKLGGAGAVYETLALWDFLKAPPAAAASQRRPGPHPAPPRPGDRLLPQVRRRAAALHLREPGVPRAHGPSRQRPHHAGAPGALRPPGPRRRASFEMLGEARIGPAGLGRGPGKIARDAREFSATSRRPRAATPTATSRATPAMRRRPGLRASPARS